MSTTIAFAPGSLALTSEPAWSFSASEIFRKALVLTQTHTFQVALETIVVLSIFVSLTIWAFAISPSLNNL